MGISEDLKVALCPKPCKGPITTSQPRLMPDGTVEVTGELPPPLCDACPDARRPQSADTPPRGPARFPPGRKRLGGSRDIESGAGRIARSLCSHDLALTAPSVCARCRLKETIHAG